MDISENTKTTFEDAGFTINTHTTGKALSVSIQKENCSVAFSIKNAEYNEDNEYEVLKTKFDGLKAYAEEAGTEIPILDGLYETLETLNAE